MPQSFRTPRKVLRRLRLTRQVARGIENWPSFMYHYALGLVPNRPYRFRSGPQLAIGRGVDHVPIIEIFLRRDYGDVPDGATIVDIGAHIGTFTVYAAASAKTSRVYAYEPDEHAFRMLVENVRLNRLGDRVRLFNAAVAGERGERLLNRSTPGFHFPTLDRTGDQGGPTVTCTTLADVLEANELAHVDLLKIDIEGSEYEVMYAARPSLLARVRAIRLEYHHIDSELRNIAALRRFLSGQGFRITRDVATTPINGALWVEKQ